MSDKKAVTVDACVLWGWECPSCGDWNEDSDEPSIGENLKCTGCHREVIVEKKRDL